MHYKRSDRVKISDFVYLTPELEGLLLSIAEWEGQNLSQIIERGVLYGCGYSWQKAEKFTRKKTKAQNLPKKMHSKAHKAQCKAKEPKQECFCY